ncbi:hypothetical protein EDC94DRAFT_592207 [Helicostylum pulchrum]|nr:hypothetical protein EDC94DRAFT_592207 [Helicostylum pulchrum]
MQSTSSFSNKLHSSKEKRNVLGLRTRGGINKRVGTSKVPRYQSTTSINAIEDIRSEMSTDDKYVSMAARIKLFEKGLGNGSNKRVPVTPHQSSSTSTTSSQGTPVPVNRSVTPALKPSPVTNNASTPSYLRKTVASETKTTKRKTSSDFREKLNLWKGKDKLTTNANNIKKGLKRKTEQSKSPQASKKR